ncbi:hypothetical protein VNO78_10191 [Psophocarpus tetragonolobus]|uniref:C3H1-type domain-containing protein n=1 Tax=Psophocarpus tetragonolobus TaxID=3891 RepID=A0AAN9SK83_PSOTE
MVWKRGAVREGKPSVGNRNGVGLKGEPWKSGRMMLGRANPSVHVPPWPEIYEGKGKGNAEYCWQEAVNALQNYEWTEAEGESESEWEVPPLDAYWCDHFRMFEFKVRRCGRGRSHDWTECPYAHPGEKARRRDPRKYHYSGTACPDFRKGTCRKGDGCEYAHGVFECWLHPARYRTQPCKDGTSCRRRVCFFAHTPDQLRVLSPLDSPPMSPPIHDALASLMNLQLGEVKSLPSPSSSSSCNVLLSPVLPPCFLSLPSTPTPSPSPSPSSAVNYFDLWDHSCEEEPVMERVESGRNIRAMMFEKLSKENSLHPYLH